MASKFTTMSPEQTEQAGMLLGPLLRPGDVIALAGDLGAGKTHLVQGVARALGVDEPVTSPTFNLLLVHPGPLPLYHFDLYRLEQETELEDIGFYETLEGDGVSLIEWGDRFPRSLPADSLVVAIHRIGETARCFELTWGGPRSTALAAEWVCACNNMAGIS
ncbi:MAG: tRNA (adenosine(37)-N6)-threonylcarbamoyltransferase complex ATPase subunit type 1 TsaE [Coriobacteriia bacterium]|nr:tRNA (adenosine(37)-N6)-threonylcarbamoyltransferase complex ATPase subunit type 1 TsaE [Coriobacteriia bacterium]